LGKKNEILRTERAVVSSDCIQERAECFSVCSLRRFWQ